MEGIDAYVDNGRTYNRAKNVVTILYFVSEVDKAGGGEY